MKKIKINLASIYTEPSNSAYVISVLTLLIAAVMTVYTIYGVTVNDKRISTLEAMTAGYEAKLGKDAASVVSSPKPVTETKEEVKELAAEVDFINGIIRGESFSWMSFLNELEKSVPRGVSLASVTPDYKDKSVKLLGFGKSKSDALNFVTKLNSSPYFTDVLLAKHASVKATGRSLEKITFIVTAKYNKEN
ncbi:MAG: PilN domain-containing protein [Deltaproteobacteria bacterium]|nr:PilN domain-containing protein [Deltaproteobacteria bacterium]